ncbi:MAG: carbohydrate ABC transporter substrate-binding protein [Eubacteriales bacterium SKADARSKE-1]|nr:carbohydrate ABC transporter substrate-binding protein [Eubacteriales bacterium SKADARSKE-1]
MPSKNNFGKIVRYIVLIIMSLYTLSPLALLILNSFKSQVEIDSSPTNFPTTWNFKYLISAMKQINFLQSFFITLIITIISVTIITLISSMAAWAMVRCKTKLSFVLFLMFVSAMLIPFQSVMFPLIHLADILNLKNIPGLIIMYSGFGLSLSVFLYHGFIKSIPKSIEEAAIIDGANIFQLFWHILFPLLKPITITVIILNSMWIWNDYLLPFLVLGNSSTKTLTLELYFAKMQSSQFGSPWELIFPAVLVSIIPIIVIFLLLQKHFVKGISAGAIKE